MAFFYAEKKDAGNRQRSVWLWSLASNLKSVQRLWKNRQHAPNRTAPNCPALIPKLPSPTVLLMPSAFPTCSMVTCWFFPGNDPRPWNSRTDSVTSFPRPEVSTLGFGLAVGNLGCCKEQETKQKRAGDDYVCVSKMSIAKPSEKVNQMPLTQLLYPRPKETTREQ